MMDCKQALAASAGDVEKAIDWLRKKGISTAAKKSARVTSEGSVASYIHAGGKIGVLVEVNCESDFVARTDDFKELVHDIAMHIAATDPKFVRKEDVTPEAYEREKDIYRSQAAAQCCAFFLGNAPARKGVVYWFPYASGLPTHSAQVIWGGAGREPGLRSRSAAHS